MLVWLSLPNLLKVVDKTGLWLDGALCLLSVSSALVEFPFKRYGGVLEGG